MKMTEQRLKELQESMTDEALIKEVENQISELARTYGRSHRMCIPPRPEDTDMIMSELVRRYKRSIKSVCDCEVKGAYEELIVHICKKCDKEQIYE